MDSRQLISDLNRSFPAANDVKLGDTLFDLTTAVNTCITALKAIADKLDADSGVNGTDFGSTITDDIAAVDTIATRAARAPL